MKQKITVLMAFLIVMTISAGCGSSAGNKVESKTAAEEEKRYRKMEEAEQKALRKSKGQKK